MQRNILYGKLLRGKLKRKKLDNLMIEKKVKK
jgi:hypothetical protein